LCLTEISTDLDVAGSVSIGSVVFFLHETNTKAPKTRKNDKCSLFMAMILRNKYTAKVSNLRLQLAKVL